MGKMVETVTWSWWSRCRNSIPTTGGCSFDTGKYIQGFGVCPERMGAPNTAYNRISDERITIHSNIYEPDYVVVVDESLLKVGCYSTEGGWRILTTDKTPMRFDPVEWLQSEVYNC